MEIVYNKTLKIFSELFVGVRPARSDASAPLAFGTPYETTSSGLKRQETVKTWVGTSYWEYDPKTKKSVKHEYTPDLRVVKNVPRTGFRITSNAKRVYWGGGNVVWRVLDPYGWELEIQSSNLFALMNTLGIRAGGEIDGECIWARDGNQNVLLSVKAQEYMNAVKSAELMKPPVKLSMAARIIGRSYELQNGSVGQYLGKFFITDRATRKSGFLDVLTARLDDLGTHKVQTDQIDEIILNGSQKQYEAIFVKSNSSYKSNLVVLYRSAPLIREVDQNRISEDEALQILKTTKLEYASRNDFDPVLATRKKPAHVRMTFRPISEDTFKKNFEKMTEIARDDLASHLNMVNNGATLPQITFSLQTMFFFDDGICLKDHDQVYVDATDMILTGIGEDNYRKFCILGVLKEKTERNTYSFVIPTRFIFGRSVLRPLDSNDGSLMNLQNKIPTKTLPIFSTIQELSTFIQNLQNAGALVERHYQETY